MYARHVSRRLKTFLLLCLSIPPAHAASQGGGEFAGRRHAWTHPAPAAPASDPQAQASAERDMRLRLYGPNEGIEPAPQAASDSGACEPAILAAERRYGIPAGLLVAIALVETGRRDPATGALHPWPWAVDADGQGSLLPSRAHAIAWVKRARSRGTLSVDVGCMQVNLLQHPDAFTSLEEAFTPSRNADYAARFLRSLHAMTGDWLRAAGAYHSQTPSLAGPYRRQVQATLAAVDAAFSASVAEVRSRYLSSLASAWSATLGDTPAQAARPRRPARDAARRAVLNPPAEQVVSLP